MSPIQTLNNRCFLSLFSLKRLINKYFFYSFKVCKRKRKAALFYESFFAKKVSVRKRGLLKSKSLQKRRKFLHYFWKIFSELSVNDLVVVVVTVMDFRSFVGVMFVILESILSTFNGECSQKLDVVTTKIRFNQTCQKKSSF